MLLAPCQYCGATVQVSVWDDNEPTCINCEVEELEHNEQVRVQALIDAKADYLASHPTRSPFPDWYQKVLDDEDANPLPPGFGPQGHGT